MLQSLAKSAMSPPFVVKINFLMTKENFLSNKREKLTKLEPINPMTSEEGKNKSSFLPLVIFSLDNVRAGLHKVAGGKGISETKLKQQSPCSNCMHHPVMSWGNS